MDLRDASASKNADLVAVGTPKRHASLYIYVPLCIAYCLHWENFTKSEDFFALYLYRRVDTFDFLKLQSFSCHKAPYIH